MCGVGATLSSKRYLVLLFSNPQTCFCDLTPFNSRLINLYNLVLVHGAQGRQMVTCLRCLTVNKERKNHHTQAFDVVLSKIIINDKTIVYIIMFLLECLPRLIISLLL